MDEQNYSILMITYIYVHVVIYIHKKIETVSNVMRMSQLKSVPSPGPKNAF